MARKIATSTLVSRAEMQDFVAPRDRAVLLTHRQGTGVRLSPMTVPTGGFPARRA